MDVDNFNDRMNSLLSGLNGKYLGPIVAIFVISYAHYAAPQLPSNFRKFLQHPIVSVIFLSVIAYVSMSGENNSITLAIMLAILFVIIMQSLVKADIEEGFEDHVQFANTIEKLEGTLDTSGKTTEDSPDTSGKTTEDTPSPLPKASEVSNESSPSKVTDLINEYEDLLRRYKSLEDEELVKKKKESTFEDVPLFSALCLPEGYNINKGTGLYDPKFLWCNEKTVVEDTEDNTFNAKCTNVTPDTMRADLAQSVYGNYTCDSNTRGNTTNYKLPKQQHYYTIGQEFSDSVGSSSYTGSVTASNA